MKGMFKRALAGIAAAALAATGLAMGAATANAALVDTANIVLTGEIKAEENRTFKAFQLGDYTTPEYVGGVLKSVGLSTDSDWNSKLVAAIGAAQLTEQYEASKYYGNPIGYIASLKTATDGEALRAIATNLAGTVTAETPSEVTNISTVVGNPGSVTVPVTDDGFYLITDSMGAPILIGSPVKVTETQYENSLGEAPNVSTLGTTALKPSSVPVPDKTVTGAAPIITFDGKSVYVGETLTYTVSVVVPNTTGYDENHPYALYIKDTADPGLTITGISSVKMGDAPLTVDTDYTVDGPTATDANTVTTVMIKNVAKHDGKTITITYNATVNDKALTDVNGVTNKAEVSRDSKDWGQPTTVTVRTYGFEFTKKNADKTVALSGAEFIISQGTKYLKYDAASKKWSAATGEADATHIASDTDGKVKFQGLPLGTYTVKEVKAPAGYMNATMPTFTVGIADVNEDGTPELTFGDDAWGLVDKTDTTAIVVKNVKNVTELPLTGAAGTMLFTVVGLLIAGAGALVYAKSRGVKRALRG